GARSGPGHEPWPDQLPVPSGEDVAALAQGPGHDARLIGSLRARPPDLDVVIGAVESGPEEVAKAGVHHHEGMPLSPGVGPRLLHIPDPGYEHGAARDQATSRLHLHPDRPTRGVGEDSAGLVEEGA